MQLVTAERDALLKPIQTVSGIVERRHTLPILSNLLLKKTGNELSFLATDIEVQISTQGAVRRRAGCRHHRRRPEIAGHPARPARVRQRLAGAEQQKLNIKAGKSRFALQTWPPRISPPSPRPPISGGFFAVAKIPQGPAGAGAVRDGAAGHPLLLNGLLLIADKKQVRVVQLTATASPTPRCRSRLRPKRSR